MNTDMCIRCSHKQGDLNKKPDIFNGFLPVTAAVCKMYVNGRVNGVPFYRPISGLDYCPIAAEEQAVA